MKPEIKENNWSCIVLTLLLFSSRESKVEKNHAVFFPVQEMRESRHRQEQRIVEVDSGVRQDYEFKLAQALQVSSQVI